jgi:GPI-anchor transamidase subunit U
MMLTMPIDRRKAAVIAAAIVLRLVVFVAFPGLPDLLTGQVEVSTPVSSFKRCKKHYSPHMAAS